MTETAFRTTHPAVLAMWEFCMDECEQWIEKMLAEQDRLGRQIYRKFSGLARREEVVGIEHQPEGDIPAGWTLSAEQEFLVPIDGAEGEPAREWLRQHQPPPSAEERLAPFGLAEHHVADGRVFWPGVELLETGLYVTWGCDTGWNGSGFFDRIKLSEYHAAREA